MIQRLALAELLIQLQVFHSFDMPRRKDLGYSIVIGLILLGVAATLKANFSICPSAAILFSDCHAQALRCFAIALPTLVLEYRSRLGLHPLKAFSGSAWEQDKNKQLPSNFFSFYFFLFTLIVGLGLGIFAVLPRFPKISGRNVSGKFSDKHQRRFYRA